MIRERIADLETLAQRVTAMRQSQQHGQALARRRQTLEGMIERAVKAKQSTELLAARLGEVAPSPSSAENALRQVAVWRTALETDLSTALGGDLFPIFHDSVLSAIGDTEAQAATLWQRHVAQHAPETSNEVLDALENDPRARLAVIRIRRLAESLRRLRDRAVPTSADIEEFDTAAVELRKTWATLDVESIDPDVVAFLRGANSERGARLDLLTVPVLAWLADRGAGDHYVIKAVE